MRTDAPADSSPRYPGGIASQRKRDGYLDLAAEGIMGRDELREKLEELERDKDALLDSYRPMLGLHATITMDGTLEIGGTFNEGDSLCGMETRPSTP
jgi:hypothetical protein